MLTAGYPTMNDMADAYILRFPGMAHKIYIYRMTYSVSVVYVYAKKDTHSCVSILPIYFRVIS